MHLREILFSNYKAKIALFLMAVFLWFFVVTSKEYVHTFHVPVRTLKMKENKVFLAGPPPSALVRFRGRGTSLLLMSLFGDVHLNLDLSQVDYSYDFPLTDDLVHWGAGIDVQALEVVSPDTIYIRLGDRERKQ